MNESNGILEQVPGQYIADALGSLPPAATTQDDQQVVISAGHVGMVRLYIERKQARHGKHSHWYWSVYRAEAA